MFGRPDPNLNSEGAERLSAPLQIFLKIFKAYSDRRRIDVWVKAHPFRILQVFVQHDVDNISQVMTV